MAIDAKVTFGENVARIRHLIGEERGTPCTQEEFAKLVQRGRSQVANWESLGRKTKDDKIAELAWIFNIPFDTLKYGVVTQLGAGWQTRSVTPRNEREHAQKQELLASCEKALDSFRQAVKVVEREFRRITELAGKPEQPDKSEFSNRLSLVSSQAPNPN